MSQTTMSSPETPIDTQQPSNLTPHSSSLLMLKRVIEPLPHVPPFASYKVMNYYNAINDDKFEERNTNILRDKQTVRRNLKQISFVSPGLWASLSAISWPTFVTEIGGSLIHAVKRTISSPGVSGIVFLCVLGLLLGLLSVFIDWATTRLIQARLYLSDATGHWFAGWIVWILYGSIFAFASAGCVQYVGPYAVGSGIPEMKTLLSGISANRFLSFRTLFAKSFSIITTVGSGFSVGRLGPFTHIAGCMAHVLMQPHLFHNLRVNQFLRNHMISAACSAGIAATFGASFGGVLFGVEVTSTYYLVTNLWRGILSAIMGSLVFFCADKLKFYEPSADGLSIRIFPKGFAPFTHELWEYIIFALMGVLIGFIGAVFNELSRITIRLRNKYLVVKNSRFWTVMLVFLLISFVDYHFLLLKNPPGLILDKLFGIKTLVLRNIRWNLAFVFVFKFIFTIVCINLPIPCGLVIPNFMIGAILGRLIGEMLNVYGNNVNAGGYAVVGACIMVSATTRALSTIVVVFEITGQMSYMLPSMVGVIIGIAVANAFNPAIFDIIIQENKFPTMRGKRNNFGQNRFCFNAMKKELTLISTDHTPEQITQILQESTHNSYPIIESFQNPCLLGEADRASLYKMLGDYHNEKSVQPNNGHHTDNFDSSARHVTTSPDYLVDESHSRFYSNNVQDDQEASERYDTVDFKEVSVDVEPTADDILIHAAKFISMNRRGSVPLVVEADLGPCCIQQFTRMNKVYYLFQTLRMSHIWVLHAGKLVGVITKKDLILENRTYNDDGWWI